MSIIYINPFQFATPAGPTDPYFSNVSLLLHGDGTNGSTAIVDSSSTPKAITAYGNAQISTAQSKFGGASIAFDGTGDYLGSLISSDYEFGTGDFTVEAWVRLNSGYSGIQRFAGIGNGAFGSTIFTGWSFLLLSNRLYFYRWTGSEVSCDVAWTPSVDTWHHITVNRSGTSLRFFVDGSQIGSTFTNTTSYNRVNSNDFQAGAYISGAGNNWLNGYIDDLRITKGVARYTTNFTPPTAPFPDA